MSIRVISPAATRDLTTRVQVKRELGLAEEGDDALIDALISQASSAIETACRRVLARESVVETVIGRGRSLLMLTRTPIVSVASVHAGGVAVAPDLWGVLSEDAGLLHRRGGWDEAPFEIAYTGGFALPGDPDCTLPGALERACLETVKLWLAARDRDPSLNAESAGGYSASYAPSRGLPDAARELLAPWRRPSFA